jgi:hypothetical protein
VAGDALFRMAVCLPVKDVRTNPVIIISDSKVIFLIELILGLQ